MRLASFLASFIVYQPLPLCEPLDPPRNDVDVLQRAVVFELSSTRVASFAAKLIVDRLAAIGGCIRGGGVDLLVGEHDRRDLLRLLERIGAADTHTR